METEVNIQELLAKIELPLDTLNGLQNASSIPAAQNNLNTFKQLIKQQRKHLSKKYHPDKGGDEERMKEINNICDWILGSEIMVMPKLQPIVTYYSYFSTSSTTTTAT